tara:strand:- start:1387 stop:2181 length:795 start_codon:yes stop_codon:yes gene_type:complete
MTFTYILPNRKEVRLKEILYKDLRTFNLYSDTALHGRLEFLESFILTKNLNILEKFYCLFYLRQKCIGNQITITSNKGPINVDLDFLLENAGGLPNIETDIPIDNITYTLDFPHHFNTGNDDFILSLVKKIRIGDEELVLAELTEEEYQEAIERLPDTLHEHIDKFIEDCKEFFTLTLLEERENVDVKPIKFNVMEYGFADFITSLFLCITTAGYREMLFALSRRINDVSFLANSTFLEVNDYFQLYRDEIENQNTKQQGGPTP